MVDAPEKEKTFFDGIDTSIRGTFNALRHPAPPGTGPLLAAIDDEVASAVRLFSMQNPSAAVPALARGLTATRTAIGHLAAVSGTGQVAARDAASVLQIKEQQFVDAINTALGIDLEAVAAVPGPVVPGQRFDVQTSLTNRGGVDIEPTELTLTASGDWHIGSPASVPSRLAFNQVARRSFSVTVPEAAALSRPYFERSSIAETKYSVRDEGQIFRPAAEHCHQELVVPDTVQVSLPGRGLVRIDPWRFEDDALLRIGSALQDDTNLLGRQAVVAGIDLGEHAGPLEHLVAIEVHDGGQAGYSLFLGAE